MKKSRIYKTVIVFSIFLAIPVKAGNPYCTGLKSTFMFLGEIVHLSKIMIPLAIIGFGILDLFKAVTGMKDGEIFKSIKALGLRLIAGVCIFFLPTIVNFIFSLVDGWVNTYENSYQECAKCLLDVSSCK